MLTASMATNSVSDVCTKLVAKTYPFGEVVAVRGFFTIIVVAIVLAVLGYWRAVRNRVVALELIAAELGEQPEPLPPPAPAAAPATPPSK